MTIEQFGQTIKQTYPQYNDVPDLELGQKIIAKYPQYQDMVDNNSGVMTSQTQTQSSQSSTMNTVQNQPQIEQQKDLAQKIAENPITKIGVGIGSFLGMKPLSEAIGQTIHQWTGGAKQQEKTVDQFQKTQNQFIDMIKKRKAEGKNTSNLEKSLRKMQEDFSSIANKNLKNIPTKKEVLGSAIQTAALIAPTGAAQKTLAKGLTTIGATKGLASLGGKVLTSAGLGYAYDVANDLKNNKSIKEVITPDWGTIIGGGIPLLSAGVEKLVNPFAKRLYGSALKISSKVQEAGKDPTQKMIEKGIWGGTKSLSRQAQNGINRAEDLIQKELGASTVKINNSDIVNNAIKKTAQEFGDSIDDKVLEDVLLNERLPFKKLLNGQTLSLQEANNVRRVIDNKFIGNNRWLFQNPDTLTTLVLKNVANELRIQIQTLAPKTKQVFADYSAYIYAKKALEKVMAINTRKNIGGLYDIIVGGSGLGIGFTTGQVKDWKDALKYGVMPVVARRVGESAVTKTGGAVLLNKLSQLGQRSAVQKATLALFNKLREGDK